MSSPKHKKREEKRLKALAKTTARNKEAVLKYLSEYPIVMTACRKADIGRATYYKWLEEDKGFAKSVEGAMLDGKRLVADMAKAQLLQLVANGKITPIIFLLKNYDPDFTDKVRYMHEHKHKHELKFWSDQVSPEQRESIRQAMHNVGLASLIKMDAERNAENDEEIDID